MLLHLQVLFVPKVKLSIDKVYENETIVQSFGDGIPEGTEAHFKCNAQANPTDVIYKWFINDVLVVGDYTTEMVSIFSSIIVIVYEIPLFICNRG